MVRPEQRPHERRKRLEQWLLRANAPVELDVDELVVLRDGPHAASDEISECLDGKTVGISALGDDEFPEQRVGLPSFRAQAHPLVEPVLV